MKGKLFVFFSLFTLFFSGCWADCQHHSCEYQPYRGEICRHSYPYLSFGTGPVLLLPTVGMGYRQHAMHHGWDLSLNYSTAVKLHLLQGRFNYHLITNAYRADPWYLGVGAAASVGFVNSGGSGVLIAPDFVIGKELSKSARRSHFIEMHVQAPTWVNNLSLRRKAASIDFPFVFISYGMAI